MHGDAPLTVGYKASALRSALLLSVVMAAAIAYAAYLTFGEGGGGAPLLPAALLVVVALASAVIVPLSLRAGWRFVLRRPLLTLDATGVTLHSARVSLPWSGLSEIRISQRGPLPDLLVFVAADPERALASLRGLPRWFARDGIRKVGGPVFVRVQDLSCPLDDVLAAARRYTDAPVNRRTVLREGSM